ncbi:hypothetical protein [Paraliomyxa miuraensis]|uniref:hypothetical protein n=1 Tax=Paraliomyxa miuraensis TaxID=376150 RepID=UPI00225006D2|nr:hypothetical protein [Paraliomyxa miuraensis]MCX4243759.1 hypothetical protein [Paraliomyxa miuraensis]
MRTLSSSLLALLLVTACDSGKKKTEPNPDEAKKATEDEEAAKRIEARRLEREAKEAAKVKEEEERKVKMAELCVVPEDAKKPKKLDAACDAAAEAQLEFLRRQYAEEPAKLEGVEKNAPMQKANLIKMCSSFEVALGLKNAFDNAPMGYGEHLNDLIATCMQKLGKPSDASAAVPMKKPG